MIRVLATYAGLAFVLAALACSRRPRSTREAFEQLEGALAADDLTAVFDLLDARSRDAVAGAFHDEQLERTIIVAKYPEADARAALARLQAADEPDKRRYFAHWLRMTGQAEALRKRPREEAAFHFVRDSDGSFGIADLDDELERAREHAWNALQTVRENARLYAGEK
jgi:hypothetical protein